MADPEDSATAALIKSRGNSRRSSIVPAYPEGGLALEDANGATVTLSIAAALLKKEVREAKSARSRRGSRRKSKVHPEEASTITDTLSNKSRGNSRRNSFVEDVGAPDEKLNAPILPNVPIQSPNFKRRGSAYRSSKKNKSGNPYPKRKGSFRRFTDDAP